MKVFLPIALALFILTGCQDKANSTKLTLQVEPEQEASEAAEGATEETQDITTAKAETAGEEAGAASEAEAGETAVEGEAGAKDKGLSDPAVDSGAAGAAVDTAVSTAADSAAGPADSGAGAAAPAKTAEAAEGSGTEAASSLAEMTKEGAGAQQASGGAEATESASPATATATAAASDTPPASATEDPAVLAETVTVSGAGTDLKTIEGQIDGTGISVEIQVSVGGGAEAEAGAEISIADIAESDAAGTAEEGAEASAASSPASSAAEAASENNGESGAGSSSGSAITDDQAALTSDETAWREELTAVWACEKEERKTVAYYLYEPGKEAGNVCELGFSATSRFYWAAFEENFCAHMLEEILSKQTEEEYECSCFVAPESAEITISLSNAAAEPKEYTCKPASQEELAQIPPPQG